MKRLKSIFTTLLLCVALAATVSSCSDDKEDEPTIPAAKSIAGSYTGDMTCSVMGSESVFEAMTFTLEATDDATVSLRIPSFGNPPMQVPEITVAGIKVTGDNGTYTLVPTEFDQEVNGKKCSGVVKGNMADKQLTIQYNLQFGAMPMPMICTFTATKK